MSLRLLVVAGLAAGSLAVPAAPASAIVCVTTARQAVCASDRFPLCAGSGSTELCVRWPFGQADSGVLPVCVTGAGGPIVCVTPD